MRNLSAISCREQVTISCREQVTISCREQVTISCWEQVTISCREQVTFWWVDDIDVRFVLDQHAELDLYCAGSLK